MAAELSRSLYAEDMAKRLSLLTSGGSDWHGMGGVLGAFFLTEEQVGPIVRKVKLRCSPKPPARSRGSSRPTTCATSLRSRPATRTT